MSNKGHIYKSEDCDCSKCGSSWSDTETYCFALNEYELEQAKKDEENTKT